MSSHSLMAINCTTMYRQKESAWAPNVPHLLPAPTWANLKDNTYHLQPILWLQYINDVRSSAFGTMETQLSNSLLTISIVRKQNKIQLPFFHHLGTVLGYHSITFDRWPWKTIGHLLVCYFKFCVSFHNHCWIRTLVRVRKHTIWVKISDFWSCETLKFDGWSWKTRQIWGIW